MTNTVIKLIVQLVFFTLAGALIGLIVGQPLIMGVLGALLWAIRHAFAVAAIEQWVKQGIDISPPDIDGPLGDVAYKVNRYDRAQARRSQLLQSTINRFQQSSSAMTDAIVIIDRNDNIEWWNGAANTLIGLVERDRGYPILNLIRSPEFVRFYRANRDGKSIVLQVNHNQYIEYHLHRFGDGDRVLVARDVSESKKIDQVRRDFVANASHELRTPLTVIHGYLEMMTDADLPKGFRNAVESMYKQSTRMESLVADLLTLSKLETEQQADTNKPVQVASLLNQIQQEAIALSEEKHEIELQCEEGLDITGNAKEIQSALSNLIFNAVRYTPEGGKISIRFSTTGSKGTRAKFEVEDTGDGIAAHHIPRLTERFYRVDAGRSRESGGTGLGLAIVKHVLVRHNAKLAVTSELGKGSRFSCVFPSKRVIRN